VSVPSRIADGISAKQLHEVWASDEATIRNFRHFLEHRSLKEHRQDRGLLSQQNAIALPHRNDG
jgi:hypothetical protein